MAHQRRILLPPKKCPKSCQSPPPLPPLPPVPMPPLRDPPANEENNGHRLTNFYLISAAIVGTCILLSLIYYAILRRRRRPIGSATAGAAWEHDDGLVSLDEEQPFHHVWYIRSVGLDESTIASIAVAEYRAGDGLLDGVSDCSICLGEFCDGERVRLLPKCGHAFHIPCIDTWLGAHTNCPLCRAHIVESDEEPAVDAGILPIAAASESADLVSGSPDSAEIHQIGNRPLEEVAEDKEEPESMIQVATPVNPSQVSGSLPESSLSQEKRELQPVRRSISLDAPSMNAIVFVLKPDEEAVIDEEGKDPNFDEENPRKMWGKQEYLAKGAMDQKGHSDIGRSLSSSGRGFFFSRHGRVSRIHSMTT